MLCNFKNKAHEVYPEYKIIILFLFFFQHRQSVMPRAEGRLETDKQLFGGPSKKAGEIPGSASIVRARKKKEADRNAEKRIDQYVKEQRKRAYDIQFLK